MERCRRVGGTGSGFAIGVTSPPGVWWDDSDAPESPLPECSARNLRKGLGSRVLKLQAIGENPVVADEILERPGDGAWARRKKQMGSKIVGLFSPRQGHVRSVGSPKGAARRSSALACGMV